VREIARVVTAQLLHRRAKHWQNGVIESCTSRRARGCAVHRLSAFGPTNIVDVARALRALTDLRIARDGLYQVDLHQRGQCLETQAEFGAVKPPRHLQFASARERMS